MIVFLSTLSMVPALHDLDPLFDKFSRQPAFARLAEILGYKKPLVLQSMIIFKVHCPLVVLLSLRLHRTIVLYSNPK